MDARETGNAMLETIITAAIILAAAIWFIRWFRGAASGEKGCSCGSCGKENCLSRTADATGAGDAARKS